MKKKFNEREKKIVDLGGAIRQMLNEYSLDQKFSQSDLLKSWPKIVGPAISSKTVRIFIKSKILFVEISSAPLKSELNQRRSLLLKRIEEELGSMPVTDIRII